MNERKTQQSPLFPRENNTGDLYLDHQWSISWEERAFFHAVIARQKNHGGNILPPSCLPSTEPPLAI
ncbi:hypothetical protein [Bartonella mastomydis]|uniref:hypothetical protein n=1 Tax=Bartonella mastomydis TaxID=1820002 RepID=UPI0015D59A79|nr:hypothetical protein [Bartonella mastomydis]